MMRKRRFAYGAWLLFAILLYFFENNTGTRTILAASVFLPAVSVLCAVRSARRVTVHLSAPDCCKQGDAAECSVRAEGLLPGAVLTAVLRGRSRLTGEETAVKLSASRFAPDAAGTLRTAHCGTVILSLSDAAVQDWFGLYRCALTVQSTRFVTVEPPLFDVRITLAENETVTADSERWSSTHPGHDPSETFGFRTYVPGDPIRQIHWKLSSKLDRLVIREPGMPAARTLLVFWDRSGDAAARDAQAEAVFSVCQSLSEQGYAYQLGWPEGGTVRFAEAGSTEELLRNLPLLLRGGAEPLQETGALRGFGKILYFTASPDPVWRSLTAGAEPVLLLCGVPEQPDVRCICYTKEDYAAALQQLEL